MPLWIIIWLGLSLAPLQQAVTGHVVLMLRIIGTGAASNGFLITAGQGGFSFYIGEDCTGWKSTICYFALISATLGVSLRKRLYGLLAGLPVIYAGNLARIMAVVFIEHGYGMEAALLFHDWLWQAGLIALVLTMWLLWLRIWALPERRR
jgi:exosortase/archaeosortase family protein